ncbi:MAG: RNA polymerase sigma factor [Gemmatimonadota bacterium]|nr:MAG: RNA polymerase sigma factor [Gemmatimonadota bacterium]
MNERNHSSAPGSWVDEAELIARVRQGDAAAERQLYQAHVDRTYRLAYRLTGDEELAQEFTQEAFIRAFDRIDQFRGDAAFGTWFRSIATSVIYNGLRKIKRFRKREFELDEASSLGGNESVAEPDLKEKLSRAIEDLPAKYRMVFVMHDVEGYTHEEISSAMGTQVGTSKAQLSRARAKLREALSQFAGEWAS